MVGALRHWLLCALALFGLAGVARAQFVGDAGVPDDLHRIHKAVDRLVEESRAAGLAYMRDKDYPAALRELNKVYELSAKEPEVTYQLARLHALMGDRAEAESFYRETLALDPRRAETALALAELMLSDPEPPDAERLSEIERLLSLAEKRLAPSLSLSLARARAAAAGGSYETASRIYDEVVQNPKAEPALRLEVGDFHRDFGHYETALSAYRQVERPPALVRAAAQRIFDLDVRRYATRLGFSKEHTATPEEVAPLLSRARVSLDQGELAQALQLLEQARSLAPTHAPVRALLAQVHLRAGRVAEAELAYLQALSLGGQETDYLVALADLYAAASPPRDAEAALYLRRALSRRPDWAALHLRLAKVERRRGDLPRALAHVRRFLERDRSNPPQPEAVALEAELSDMIEKTGRPVPALEKSSAGPAAAHVGRAQEHLRRGDTDAALVVLERVPKAQRSDDVVLLHARVLHASGRHAEAAAVLRARLVRKPDSPLRLALARALERAGDPDAARREWLQAEDRGFAQASLELARLDTEGHGPFALLHARRRLLSLLDDPDAETLHGEARALLANANGGLVRWLLGVAAVLLFPFGLVWGVRQARYGGIDLSTLAERHPEAGPELQTILSALRHEVLKHNTMMLAGLREALSAGRPAGEHGLHLVRALFGGDGVEGAHDRLSTYARQLEQLGRAHGERVNLRHRDPVMSALFTGMDLLGKVADKLERVDNLGQRARARVIRKVEEADAWLNDEGYGQLRALLDQIRVYTVLPQAPGAIFERVRAEPGLAGLAIARLRVEDMHALPCTVDMPQAAFEDIMANLMRNALQSSARARPSEAAGVIEIGLSVREELDPVTALSRVLFMVWDRSPESFSVDQLRGHYIEQGLGLTADLATRFQASLEVVPGEGDWGKAVVLALPLAVEDDPSVVEMIA